MRKPGWVKVLSGHAGSLLVAAELEKRGILVNVLPETFEGFDLTIRNFGGSRTGTVQVKACHPDRADSIDLGRKADDWVNATKDDFVTVVWLGSMTLKDPPQYWIVSKPEFGKHVRQFKWRNRERRFAVGKKSRHRPLQQQWKGNWEAFKDFQPNDESLMTASYARLLLRHGPP